MTLYVVPQPIPPVSYSRTDFMIAMGALTAQDVNKQILASNDPDIGVIHEMFYALGDKHFVPSLPESQAAFDVLEASPDTSYFTPKLRASIEAGTA